MSRQKLRQIMNKKRTVDDDEERYYKKPSSTVISQKQKTVRLDDEPREEPRRRYQDSDSDEVPLRRRQDEKNRQPHHNRDDVIQKSHEDKVLHLDTPKEEQKIEQEELVGNDTMIEKNEVDKHADSSDDDIRNDIKDDIRDRDNHEDVRDDHKEREDTKSKKYDRELNEDRNIRSVRDDSDDEPRGRNTKKYRDDSDDEPRGRNTKKYRDDYDENSRERRRRNRDDDEDKIRFVSHDKKYRDDYDEDNDLLENSNESRPFDHIPKNVFVKYLKALNTNSGADAVQAVLVILNEVVYNLFFKILNRKEDNVITLKDIKELINFYIEEDQLPDETFIGSNVFEKGIRNVCEDSKCLLKRESVSYTHLFTEYLLTKIVNNAHLIAKNARRNRISGKDILLSYKLTMG